MPKIGKMKFHEDGTMLHNNHTWGEFVSLDLYYHHNDDVFYFKGNELNEKLKHGVHGNPYPTIFKDCKTKKQAWEAVNFMFNPTGEVKKWIKPSISTPHQSSELVEKALEEQGGSPVDLNKFLIEIMHSNYGHSRLSVSFSRFISITNKMGTFYVAADEEWEYNPSSFNSYAPVGIIEWSKEKEKFFEKQIERKDKFLAKISEQTEKFQEEQRQRISKAGEELILFFHIKESELQDKILNQEKRLF
jgi:hypothetical protein